MSPACGPPTSLSPENVTRSAPAARRSLGIGSWSRPNAAVSISAPEPRSSTSGTAEPSGEGRRARRHPGSSTKPAWRKFERWTRRMSAAAALGERRLEVRRAGAVRRADLDEPGAGAPHDLGDAHAAPDLHELAARDEHAAAAREADRERQRGRVVVRDERILARPSARRGAPPPRGSGSPRRPVSRSSSSRTGSAAARAAASIAAAGHAARPRFVWTMTPVALMTETSPAPPGSAKAPRRGDDLVRRGRQPNGRRQSRCEVLALVRLDVAGDVAQRCRVDTSDRHEAERQRGCARPPGRSAQPSAKV